MSDGNDIFDTLIKEHREVAGLFEKLGNTSSDDREARQSLVRQLSVELTSHGVAESKSLYQSLQAFDETRDQIRDNEKEHETVTSMLQNLSQMEPDNEEWAEKLSKVQEDVEHHVDEEENELFPQARKLLDEEEVNNLQGLFTQEKERARNDLR